MVEWHSQNGEDELLARMFGLHVGTCVEVGAHDGVTFSNTYAFERLGWKCILVEGNAELCRQIRLRRGDSAVVFECAASGSNGTAVMKVGCGTDDVYSTLENANTGLPGGRFREVTVPTRTLDSILEAAGADAVDFVSIDVEGHELSVLAGFNPSRWSPRFVLLEDSSDFCDGRVCKRMEQAGYFRFYRSGGNDWYARRAESRLRLLLCLSGAECFSLKGMIKGTLPLWLIRHILLFYRSTIQPVLSRKMKLA
jgi:FkbM family methyltransferase